MFTWNPTNNIWGVSICGGREQDLSLATKSIQKMRMQSQENENNQDGGDGDANGTLHHRESP